MKQTVNRDWAKSEIFKAYGKYDFYGSRFSLELGKDSVNVGPAEYGVLLSNNAEPFLMLKLQTERALKFAGLWNFIVLNGWLDEKRQDVSNPQVFLVRVAWKPVSWLEAGGTRSTQYGGAGRPDYKVWEYPQMFFGEGENVAGYWDNDGYAGYDLAVTLPPGKLHPKIKTAKVYYSDTGTDIEAFWQREGGKYIFPFGFRLTLHAYQAGALIETENDSYRFEFAAVNPLFYTHHWYSREGYTYQGMSLGEPYGRNMKRAAFTHKHKFNPGLSLAYTLGCLVSPAFARNGVPLDGPVKETRYYLAVNGSRTYNSVVVEPYLRVDKTKNYDTDPLPTQFNVSSEDKLLLTTGLSVTYKF